MFFLKDYLKKCSQKIGCTCIPNKIFTYNLIDCCKLHDELYTNKNLTRKQSDKKFKLCLQQQTNTIISTICYLGVRTFGWYFWRLK